ncbi:hypothetical protein PLESTB_001465600 [Pleodorina starrii]|uniref:AB hydrolase-1 domain-containing protein n=1 Tax=Pleodorina starrii TaxID=330485 RepID=A0A9W6BWP7_9CHLO|nr:hypothetical protein PLESTM_001683700 [Pleodorina starrii]GLC59242.1 hypothetical protein PLESTB_001465600 [Pleodorina starrii]GLC74806.1 hypothetical protein PLESTF_001558100 [Pleodorina starrii]
MNSMQRGRGLQGTRRCPVPRLGRGVVRLTAHRCLPSQTRVTALASPVNDERNDAVALEPKCNTVEPNHEPNWGEEMYWDWDYNSRICYRQVGESGPPILMLHGFGVAGWHFHRNWEDLQRDHRCWAVDLLGQGRSWPQQPVPASAGLYYSVDTWTRQLEEFVQSCIGEPVYVAGNSLGGYLAVMLAARRPDLVRGLALLNATPFWAFRPPRGSAAARGLIWSALDRAVDGSVPVPEPLKRVIERYWWDQLRSPATISAMLRLVYADKSRPDPPLVSRIVEATQQPGALDAFTSIVLSPKTERSFDELVDELRCPVLLLYGKEDPWVRPLWGQRLKRRLPAATYLELSPAGHCPHHEAPAAVNRALRAWIAAQEAAAEAGEGRGEGREEGRGRAGEGEGLGLAVGESWEVVEADGRVVRVSHIEGRPRSCMEWLDLAVWSVLGRALGAVGGAGGGEGTGRGARA